MRRHLLLGIALLGGLQATAQAAPPAPRDAVAKAALLRAADSLCALPNQAPIDPVVARLTRELAAAGFPYPYPPNDAANNRALAVLATSRRATRALCQRQVASLLAQQVTADIKVIAANREISASEKSTEQSYHSDSEAAHLREESNQEEDILRQESATLAPLASPPADAAHRGPPITTADSTVGSGGAPAPLPGGQPIVGSAVPPTASPPPPGPSDVDAALRKLIAGNVAFNAPDKATIGTGMPVEARLSVSESPAALAAELTGPGAKQTAALQVGDRMVATLDGGAAFDVSPAGPQAQFVSHQQTTAWDWTVTPKQSGQQTLTLSFDAMLTVDGQQGTRRINTLRRNIEVVVAPPAGIAGWLKEVGDFMNNVSWLWSAPLLAIGGFAWHLLRRKKKAGNPPA